MSGKLKVWLKVRRLRLSSKRLLTSHWDPVSSSITLSSANLWTSRCRQLVVLVLEIPLAQQMAFALVR
jgi:hypothetical protein